MACPNGAEPDPAHAGETLAIQALAIGADALEWISGWWPAAAATATFAIMPIDSICKTNMDDPGPLQPSMILADLQDALLPGLSSPNGTLGWWLFQKAMYPVFQRYCRCIGTGATPPPPVDPNLPTGTSPFPTDKDSQPQLTRIEDNQATSAAGLTSLYNALQFTRADVGDLSYYLRQQLVLLSGGPPWAMSGEGMQLLPGQASGFGDQIQDNLGIVVQLTSIPSTVKRRGTTYQRLYGVGSVEWSVAPDPSDPHIIAQRDALHYELQFLQAPLHAQSYAVRWRLQPGVQAIGRWIPRNSVPAIYGPMQPLESALTHFYTWNAPPGWSDPPFYPQSAARVALPGGGVPP